ncbi:MAG: FkbM family methyltransferase [Pseudomonadota bacterium]|nr:FkbM family methyltransferase [Pseudomonadota bacterium]
MLDRLTRLPRQLRAIARHPMNRGHGAAAIGRWLGWQVGSRLVPGPVLIPFVDDTRLIATPGQTGVTGNIFTGLAEWRDMGFALHLLRPDDLFVDAGANAGSWTVLASGAVGSRTVAIEPVPDTADRLERNIRVNDLALRVEVFRGGLSDAGGELRFTTDFDTVNRIARDGEAGVALPVRRLDDLLAGRVPALVKIDVEGHEARVLAGAPDLLGAPGLLAVIVETAPETADGPLPPVWKTLEGAGFTAVEYDPIERRLAEGARVPPGLVNMIFVRDRDAVTARLRGARAYRTVARTL